MPGTPAAHQERPEPSLSFPWKLSLSPTGGVAVSRQVKHGPSAPHLDPTTAKPVHLAPLAPLAPGPSGHGRPIPRRLPDLIHPGPRAPDNNDDDDDDDGLSPKQYRPSRRSLGLRSLAGSIAGSPEKSVGRVASQTSLTIASKGRHPEEHGEEHDDPRVPGAALDELVLRESSL
jgi:hypothetical protein